MEHRNGADHASAAGPDESRTVTIKEAANGGRVTRTQRVPRLLSFSLKWTVMAGEGSGHYLTTGTSQACHARQSHALPLTIDPSTARSAPCGECRARRRRPFRALSERCGERQPSRRTATGRRRLRRCYRVPIATPHDCRHAGLCRRYLPGLVPVPFRSLALRHSRRFLSSPAVALPTRCEPCRVGYGFRLPYPEGTGLRTPFRSHLLSRWFRAR